MERWSGIPADGLLTMPITLAVPFGSARRARVGQPGVDRGGKHRADGPVPPLWRDIDRFHGFDRPIRFAAPAGVQASGGHRNPAEALPLSPHCEGGPTTTQRLPGTTLTARTPRPSSGTC